MNRLGVGVSGTGLLRFAPKNERGSMQRGRVLQYNPQDGCGYLAMSGTQVPFTIHHWRGEYAPVVNRSVDVEMQDGVLEGVWDAADGNSFENSSVPAEAQGRPLEKKAGDFIRRTWRSLLDTVGPLSVAAQIVYVVALFGLPALTVHYFGFQGSVTLDDLLTNPNLDISPIYSWMLDLSCVVIFLPTFVKRNEMWLVLTLPFLLVVIAATAADAKLNAVGNMGGEFWRMAEGMMRSMVSVDYGFYVLLAATVVLAVQGLRKYLQRGILSALRQVTGYAIRNSY